MFIPYEEISLSSLIIIQNDTFDKKVITDEKLEKILLIIKYSSTEVHEILSEWEIEE